MDLIPGFVQGIVRVCISYPFDNVRVNLQSSKHSSSYAFLKNIKFSTKSLYKGLGIPLMIVPIDRSFNFFLFEKLKQKQFTSFQSSIISTLITSLYSIPANFLSTHILLSDKNTKNAIIDFKNNKTYFRGSIPDISRGLLASTLFMTTYGYLRDNIPIEKHNYMIFGIISSISSWSVTYPLDTIRVLKQYNNSTYYSIIKNNYNILYKGYSLILLRAIPSAGLGMYTYEYARNLINNYKIKNI